MLNKSITTIRRWVDEEAIIPVEDENGVQRFDPDDIEALKLSMLNGADTPQVLEAAGGMVEAGSGMLKGAEKHVENLLKLVTEPSQQLLEQYGEENDRLRQRCGELEDKLSDLLDSMEEVMSRKHERAMDALQVQAGIQRKNLGIKTFMSYAPILAGQLMRGKKADGKEDPKESALVTIIQSLEADKLILLKHTGFVTEEQFMMLKTMLTPEQLMGLQKIEDAMESSGESSGDEEEGEDDEGGEAEDGGDEESSEETAPPADDVAAGKEPKASRKTTKKDASSGTTSDPDPKK